MKTKPWERKNFYANPEVQLVKRARRTPEHVEIDDAIEELTRLESFDWGGWRHLGISRITIDGVPIMSKSYSWMTTDELSELITQTRARLTSLKEARSLREAMFGKGARKQSKGGRL
jgi:hypothetical protein